MEALGDRVTGRNLPAGVRLNANTPPKACAGPGGGASRLAHGSEARPSAQGPRCSVCSRVLRWALDGSGWSEFLPESSGLIGAGECERPAAWDECWWFVQEAVRRCEGPACHGNPSAFLPAACFFSSVMVCKQQAAHRNPSSVDSSARPEFITLEAVLTSHRDCDISGESLKNKAASAILYGSGSEQTLF